MRIKNYLALSPSPTSSAWWFRFGVKMNGLKIYLKLSIVYDKVVSVFMSKKWFYRLRNFGLVIAGLMFSACNEGSAERLFKESNQATKTLAEEGTNPASTTNVSVQTSSSDPVAG